MLAAFREFGPERAVTRFVGMFAIALWDRAEATLRLMRDRLGVKPLYWCRRGGVLLFGSELKALMAHPSWRGEIDRRGRRGVHALQLRARSPRRFFAMCTSSRPAPSSPCRPARSRASRPIGGCATSSPRVRSRTNGEAAAELETILRDSVRARMVADVPLGAFLSGGVDSSTVVALMQAQSARKVKTFSIGFHESGYDEARYAKAVAGHLGTDHTELYVTPRQAMDAIPNLPNWFDEPFADSSQIPTFLVSAMTRRHVTVALSGDGGDELFAGYPRYRIVDQVWRRFGWVPPGLRRLAGKGLAALPEPLLDRIAALLPRRSRPLNAGRKARRLGALLALPADDALFLELSAIWPEAAALVPGSTGALHLQAEPDLAGLLPDPVARMQYYDTKHYLPGDILTKVDRCSMAVALEAREPLLDHRLVEFAWSLPRHLVYDGRQTKRLLRQVLYRYVPPALIERPKMGFSIPLGGLAARRPARLGRGAAGTGTARRRRHSGRRRSAAAMGRTPGRPRNPRKRTVERADVPGLESALPDLSMRPQALRSPVAQPVKTSPKPESQPSCPDTTCGCGPVSLPVFGEGGALLRAGWDGGCGSDRQTWNKNTPPGRASRVHPPRRRGGIRRPTRYGCGNPAPREHRRLTARIRTAWSGCAALSVPA